MKKSNKPIALAKYIATSGYTSRRLATDLVKNQQVLLNGQIEIKPYQPVTPSVDIVKVITKHQKITINHQTKEYLYLILNKPRDYITTTKDTHQRKTVMDLVSVNQRIYPIGRLDKDTQGLLLFTNDGKLAQQLMHPSNHVPKTYHVTIKGQINIDKLQPITQGMEIDSGLTQPAKVKIISKSRHATTFSIILTEGKKRMIRKMCALLRLFILDLVRIKFANLSLDNLKSGQWRYLNENEITKLKTYLSDL